MRHRISQKRNVDFKFQVFRDSKAKKQKLVSLFLGESTAPIGFIWPLVESLVLEVLKIQWACWYFYGIKET